MRLYLTLLVSTLFIQTCSQVAESIHIPYNHKHVYYEGRIGDNGIEHAAEIYWPGSSISLKFHGESIGTTLEDQNGENFYNVVVDGTQVAVLQLSKGIKKYVLVENLVEGEHTIELHKRNDWGYGWTRFYGFDIMGSRTLPTEAKEIFVEFYGNSITTGYGNEDYSGEDKSSGDVTNNYKAYGAITARNLGAEYSCISHSGIGILVSWHDLIMSEEYKNRFGNLNPTESQIVDAYVDFLRKIRGHYPGAEIVCLLGNMDITRVGSPWPEYVKKAAAIFNDRVHTLFVPYKDSPGHPKVAEQKRIADALTDLILRIDEVH